MITPCPHCFTQVEIDPSTHTTLQGRTHFACPACQGAVPVPAVDRPQMQLNLAPGTRTPVTSPQSHSPHTGTAKGRKSNRNLLILGATALLVLGGIAFLLASKKSSAPYAMHKNIHNEITNNSFFTRLIDSGATTQKDLAAITDIRPWMGGFMGVTKEMLDWNQARKIAQRAGGDILSVEDSSTDSDKVLIEWVASSYESHLTAPIWVQAKGGPRLLDGNTLLDVTALDRPRKAIIQWGLAKEHPTQSLPPTNVETSKERPEIPEANLSETARIAEKEANIKGCTGGIGAMIERKDAKLRINRVVPDSPTERAGLRPGWEIEAINKTPVAGMTVSDAVKLLRGPIGSNLELELIDADGRDVVVRLIREKVLLTPVECRVIEGNVLWITPNYFDLETPREFRELLQKHFSAKGLIIDMRGSGGGVADASADVAGLFLPKDTELWFGKEANGTTWATKRGVNSPASVPLVLLANGKTSYGGELFTAALQREKRAVVIGQSTAGVPVQMRDVVKSDDGSSKMRDRGTYLLNRDGTATLVVPDVVLPASAPDEEFLKAALEVIAMKQGGQPRWTSKDGKSIHGEFLNLEDQSLVIRKDGKDFKIPLSNLSPASLAQARILMNARHP